MGVPDDVLRPGLEVAFVLAVVGARQRPPITPPAALRPFLNFQKLPNAALAPVRKVVEEDDAFRARVAAVATEEVVQRPSWLWLHRPEGWEEELATLAEAVPEPDGQGSPKAQARRAEAAEAKVRRLSSELAALKDEVDRAQDGRQRAERELAKMKARSEELERSAARSRQKAGHAIALLAEAQQAAEAARAEAEELRRRPAPPVETPPASVDTAPPPVDSVPSLVEAAAPPDAPLPRKAVDALGSAASAAAALAASLQDLADSFDHGSTVPDTAAALPSANHADVAEPLPEARPADGVPAYTAPRRALRLPRGLHLNTQEADAWLLTQAEATVVVDGYNVAKLGWPDAVLADQRERLLDVLDDLACRYATTVQVVFDGADVGPVRSPRRRRVAVRFSPAAVLADDVIREIVAGLPPSDPVIVVTNDRAVAHDVRAVGANVVTSDGLLAVARR
ncbi:MAG TPA: NYN domain-containing protein [Acidimicrobiales bacterium]|nr:NYN domain-containing protein [Acidimicrobiales bacterium]